MKPLNTIFVALAMLAVVVGGGGIAFAQSGKPAPATDNLTVRDGINPGEIIIAWDYVPQAIYYRIGYVNMVTDYPMAKASVTGEWIEAFVYVDVNARNLAVTEGRTEYTVRRLEQGVRHAVTVLTSNSFVNTTEIVSSEFSWPSNPRWQFHTVADRGGAVAPAPIDWVSLYPNCDAVRAHYPGGVKQGSPIYRPALDRDGDGIACEDTSAAPSSNYLPIQSIGTFTGTGDNADNILHLEEGLYRANSTLDGRGYFGVKLESVSTDDWELLANEAVLSDEEPYAHSVETFRVGGNYDPPSGNYLLSVESEGDWEVQIELLGGN